MAHADRIGSTIVLANDPDADRFCAAEKVDGKWNVFTGDQLGTLLGSWVLRKYKESGAAVGETDRHFFAEPIDAYAPSCHR